MPRCLIGCGSNQGARREQLDRAIELLGVMPGVRLEAVSRHRETRPVGGPPDQPPFLNGACLIDTELSPHELLGLLAAVENTLHRDRAERWGPRTVDLDLLLYDDVVIDDGAGGGTALTVPHPRMVTRRFVLEPAVEIAPDLLHPVAGCSLRDLLDNISAPHLHVSVVGVPGAGAAEVAAAVADATLARHVHARTAMPRGVDESEWIEALVRLAAPLEAVTWPADAHGTVADYWLGALPVLAEETLPPRALSVLVARQAEVEAATVPPHVAIFLRLSPAGIGERIACLSRAGCEASDLFAGLTPDPDAAALNRLQQRLLARLRCRGAAPRPPALVIVEADDMGRAVDEAIAAVEAAG